MTPAIGKDARAAACDRQLSSYHRVPAGALEDLLRPLGYRFNLLTSEWPRPMESIEAHPEWLNYVFTPPAVDPHDL